MIISLFLPCMKKGPRNTADSGADVPRHEQEIGRLGRLVHFLRPGERTLFSSDVLLRKGDRGTIQRAATYDDFRPLPDAEQEAQFRYTVEQIAESFADSTMIALHPKLYEILEGLSAQKGTNLTTIFAILTGRPVFCKGTVFRVLTDEEAEAMLRERAEPQTVGAAIRKLLRSFLRG